MAVDQWNRYIISYLFSSDPIRIPINPHAPLSGPDAEK